MLTAGQHRPVTSTARQELPRHLPPERASYRRVLGAGEFRAIFVADIVSMLGNVVAAVALTVLIYQQTRSPALAASVMALAFLPYPSGGPPEAVWAVACLFGHPGK